MKAVYVVWHPQHPQFWDSDFLEPLFNGRMWTPVNGYEFVHRGGSFPEGQGAVVVVSARMWYRDESVIDSLNAGLARLPWALIIVTGDEEGRFPHEQISHPNKKVWAMMPRPGITKADRYLPCGYTPGTEDRLREVTPAAHRDLNWFFSGQNTHARREECIRQLRKFEGGIFNESKDFSAGMSHADYFAAMVRAKVVPCPAGYHTVDSFRLAEAMEAGCIPIVDTQSTKNGVSDYWGLVFGSIPFPIIDDWTNLPQMIGEQAALWSAKSSSIGAWWMAQKRQIAYNLRDDLNALQAECPSQDLLGEL